MKKIFHSILIFSALFFLISIAHLEKSQNEWYTNPSWKNWGIGIILPSIKKGFEKGLKLKSLIPVYDSIDGEKIGYLERDPDKQFYHYVWRTISLVIDNKKLEMSHYNDYRELGYERQGIIVFSNKKGHIRIFKNTQDKNNSKESFWVKHEDLLKLDLRYTSWSDFFTNKEWGIRYGGGFYVLIKPCLNLRRTPDTQLKSIYCFKNDWKTYMEIIGDVKKKWAKVKVNVYDKAYANENGINVNRKIKRTYIGYMKIIDDTGFPNIWYYTRD